MIARAKRRKDGDLWQGKWIDIQEHGFRYLEKKEHGNVKFIDCSVFVEDDRAFNFNAFEEFKLTSYQMERLLKKINIAKWKEKVNE